MTDTINTFFTKTAEILFGTKTETLNQFANTRLAEYGLLKSYQTIFERNKLKRPVHSTIDIAYSSTIKFGSNEKTVRAQMSSQPKMALFNTNGINRKILLFSEKIVTNQVLVEMHFHKNALFYFKFLFTDASPELRIDLMKQLLEQYKLPNVDLTLHSIYDSANNCIQIRDLATLEVMFTNMDSPFFEQLIQTIEKTDNQLLVDYHLTSAPIIKR